MDFFKKNKDEKSNLPPAPMPPVPMPPVPTNTNGLNGAPTDLLKQSPSLSAPPIPSRNSFDDIKSQVVSGMQERPIAMQQISNGNSNDQNNLSEDSLFDFSTLDIHDDASSGVSLQDTNISSSSFSDSPDVVDPNARNTEHLKFIGNRNKFGKSGQTDSLYVTTSEFKTFLELVEQVRNRVKDSSDRHLRLLDIKSEEDTEYENLRRDFQYIEDKLYEVDSLIFDK